MSKYHTIYADPPWRELGAGKVKRGADRHYPLMSSKAIAALPVEDLAEDNAHLYLWVTNNFLADGLKVVEAWGFRYVTNIVWVKDKFGLGYYFRGKHELLLFAVRGKLKPSHKDFQQTPPDPPRRLFEMPEQPEYELRSGAPELAGTAATPTTVIYAPRREHSRKPDEFYHLIETVSPPPRIELFARRTRPNWDTWGNEVRKDIEL